MDTTASTAKTATITLHAGAATLVLLATRRADGSAVTMVTERAPNKAASRGMTETHADMDVAKKHLTVLADRASKLGWARRTGAGFAAKADAFDKLPAPPRPGKDAK